MDTAQSPLQVTKKKRRDAHIVCKREKAEKGHATFN